MRAKIEIDVRQVVDDIGIDEILKVATPEEMHDYYGRQDPTELGKFLKRRMSHDALAELKAALG